MSGTDGHSPEEIDDTNATQKIHFIPHVFSPKQFVLTLLILIVLAIIGSLLNGFYIGIVPVFFGTLALAGYHDEGRYLEVAIASMIVSGVLSFITPDLPLLVRQMTDISTTDRIIDSVEMGVSFGIGCTIVYFLVRARKYIRHF